MSKKSLDQLMEKNNIDTNGSLAETIRQKCSVLSSVSEQDFNLILKIIKNKGSSKSPVLTKKQGNIDNPEYKPKTELLRYGKAIGYVVKNAPQVDATKLVANVDPLKQVGSEFYYSIPTLETEIRNARKHNLYARV